MNRTLALFSNPIPYYKGLRPLAGSVTGAILMQQLEYWFDRMGDGFYKFMDSCSHGAYKPGDSWTEELGFSLAEFRSAFDQIGVRYKSKKEYSQAIAAGRLFKREKEKEALYCSYFDKIKGLTRYFRNNRKVDAEIEILCTTSVLPVDSQSQSTEMQKVNPPILTNSISGDAESESRYITEITSETTPEITTIHKSVHESEKVLTSFSESEEEAPSDEKLKQVRHLSSNAANTNLR